MGAHAGAPGAPHPRARRGGGWLFGRFWVWGGGWVGLVARLSERSSTFLARHAPCRRRKEAPSCPVPAPSRDRSSPHPHPQQNLEFDLPQSAYAHMDPILYKKIDWEVGLFRVLKNSIRQLIPFDISRPIGHIGRSARVIRQHPLGFSGGRSAHVGRPACVRPAASLGSAHPHGTHPPPTRPNQRSPTATTRCTTRPSRRRTASRWGGLAFLTAVGPLPHPLRPFRPTPPEARHGPQTPGRRERPPPAQGALSNTAALRFAGKAPNPPQQKKSRPHADRA